MRAEPRALGARAAKPCDGHGPRGGVVEGADADRRGDRARGDGRGRESDGEHAGERREPETPDGTRWHPRKGADRPEARQVGTDSGRALLWHDDPHETCLTVLAAATILLSSAAAAQGRGLRSLPGRRQPRTAARRLPDSSEAPDFALRDQDGTTVSMSSQRGRFTLVTFLYTNCPDVCPLIAEHLNTALRQLGTTRADTRVLAVSVDPKGDTPSAVRQVRRETPPAAAISVSERHRGSASADLGGLSRRGRPTARRRPRSATPRYVLLVDPQGTERLLYDSQVRAGTSFTTSTP